MRKPGVREARKEALDEVAMEFNSCPVCEEYLNHDEESNWDLRIVRSRRCNEHGNFFIHYSISKQEISVVWIFERYLPDLR